MIDDATMQRLLEADVDELEGRTDSGIARLVRENADVRSMARTILTTMRDADAAVASVAAAHADRLSAGHGSKATTQPLHPSATSRLPEVVRRRSRPATGRRVRPALASLGVAVAAIALIVIAGPDPAVTPARDPTASEPMTASLDVSSSRPFAVFPTDNPDIASVWLFDEEER
jgi:hypothetical protein